jgi:hypothetical protein
MKNALPQELLTGSLALLCVVIVFVAAILDSPAGADATRPASIGRATR